MKAWIKTLPVAICLTTSMAFAQLPGSYESVAIYKEARELMDFGKYTAARLKYEQFLSSDEAKLPQHQALREQSMYQAALCSYFLLNHDAESRLEEFLRIYPSSAKQETAKFYLAKLHFLKQNYTKAAAVLQSSDPSAFTQEIGRASCRERV